MLRVKGCIVDKSEKWTDEEERDVKQSMGLEEAMALLEGNLRKKKGAVIDREKLGIAK
ncbi:hypothetical protein PMIN06_009455 [Paraphaeosphaeria minitans]